ncbi:MULTISPECIES: methyltransferase FkbM [Pseudanabaena]|uniref:Methyltransferase FkbM n=2 Tax=Pseudanabaena TaxID=1152 RepID=L8N5E0_9CYAN|nr:MULTISPECIES: methyltransferase FkbM [Pseudanabaena]ELS34329.1 methyltransferase FkbM [Pseudanabaena biceps PCC 7429]MDG3493471.1 glycosyltransferase family 2 protein [Pseudanabaena catenata USMAC16]
MDSQLLTPVVFIIFNRPDTTKIVFEAIRQAKPQTLLVIADGPRPSHFSDVEKCEATRSIIEGVDWECNILKNYSDINLGCKQRVSSGLDWVFDSFESAIILEDDCLPDPTFFRFCSELLNQYADDERIMVISGNNFQFGRRRTENSYYFSAFTHCWGWATWRRAWQHYDIEMKLWPTVRDNGWLKDILHFKYAISYWEYIFQSVFDDLINSWAYRWLFTCWMQGGLTVIPNINLVSNIGFNNEATHTKRVNHIANIPTERMGFPLLHPQFLIRDTQSDNLTQKNIFRLSILKFIKIKIKKALNSITK